MLILYERGSIYINVNYFSFTLSYFHLTDKSLLKLKSQPQLILFFI